MELNYIKPALNMVKLDKEMAYITRKNIMLTSEFCG